MNWRVKLPVTLNEQTHGTALVKEIVKYYAQRRGVLSLAAGIAYGFVRTGPELAVPGIQYVLAHASYSDPQVRTLDRTPGMTVTPLPVPSGIDELDPRQVTRSVRGTGNPAELPCR